MSSLCFTYKSEYLQIQQSSGTGFRFLCALRLYLNFLESLYFLSARLFLVHFECFRLLALQFVRHIILSLKPSDTPSAEVERLMNDLHWIQFHFIIFNFPFLRTLIRGLILLMIIIFSSFMDVLFICWFIKLFADTGPLDERISDIGFTPR